MKQMNSKKSQSKMVCSKSSPVLNHLNFKTFGLKTLGLLLIFILVFGISMSIFSNFVFADEANSNAKQEPVQNQENSQNQKSFQDSNQTNTQDVAQKQTPQTVETVKGIKSPQKVMLNGRDVEISAYNINDENYFKLRDIAALVTDTNKSFDVFYNKEKNMIEITRNKKYQKIEGDLAPLADGKVEGVKSPQILEIDKKREDVRAYNIMGNNYFRLRDLGEKLGIDVDFDIMDNKVLLVTERIAPKPVPKGEIKEIEIRRPDGVIAYEKIYPKEIEDEPMRTCYPRAPKGKIVFDILENCYFNDKGEPVTEKGNRTSTVFREVIARRLKIDPFSIDLRRITSGYAGGKPGNWNSNAD